MRINYFSDLHLEFGSQDLPENDADVVIAAGDIGVFNQGVEWLKTIDKPVIYVAGNHEFYNGEYTQVLKKIRDDCHNTNIMFLEQEQLIFNGVRFLGCTLWTDLFVEGEEKAEVIGHTINDFKRIQFSDENFNQKHFSALFQESKSWLVNCLAQPFTGKTIVVTHHAPTEWSWIHTPNSIKKLAYCNDLKPLIYEYEIAAWFHGHVHNLGDYRIADARILSNTRGYIGRKLVNEFDINKIVEI